MPVCICSSEMHFSALFQKITDINAWKTILKYDKRCFTCLKKGNNATKVAESVKDGTINRFALKKPSTRPVTQLSHHSMNQESKARGTTKFIALQRQPPLWKMQTRNTENHHVTQSIVSNSHGDREKWSRNKIDYNQIIVRQWESAFVHHR